MWVVKIIFMNKTVEETAILTKLLYLAVELRTNFNKQKLKYLLKIFKQVRSLVN